MISWSDYEEKVYAGVLGKIIGVYLGRPVEDWSHDRIMAELGEVSYYISESLGSPLVVNDDDIVGTFTFYRALEDYSYLGTDMGSQEIGDTWLNYVIENRSVFFWGGKGISTEHTAFLRLKDGVKAPLSGSAKLNGTIVSEQIGAQIFIEPWGMTVPGNPLLASTLAGKAARVSHDGEAVAAAQMIAAMVALSFANSFTKKDIMDLILKASAFIDQESLVKSVTDELLALRSEEDDWHAVRKYIAENYGYGKFGGGTPAIPNFALVLLGLLYSGGNFQRGLSITATSGWDTDCNCANVGCILGILGGLAGIDENVDFRGPVADRLYIPTADGGRAITDAVQEAYRIADAAKLLAGIEKEKISVRRRFNFGFPGSLQGFHFETGTNSNQGAAIANVEIEGEGEKSRVLHITVPDSASGQIVRLSTATFVTSETPEMTDYILDASPTLYSGQTVTALIGNHGISDAYVSLYVQTASVESFRKGGTKKTVSEKPTRLRGGEKLILTLTVPETGGVPVCMVGVSIHSAPADLYLHYLDWNSTPRGVLFARDVLPDNQFHRPWIQACDILHTKWSALLVSQSRGRGFALIGTQEWENYQYTVTMEPKLFESAGLIVAFHGLRRYVSVELSADRTLSIVEWWDGDSRVLGKGDCPFKWEDKITMSVVLSSSKISARCSGLEISAITPSRFTSGAVGIVVESGSVMVNHAKIMRRSL